MTKMQIKVVPRASKNEIVGQMADGSLKVRLTAAPVDGKANDALIKILSDHFKTAKSKIKIVRGLTSKNKIIEME